MSFILDIADEDGLGIPRAKELDPNNPSTEIQDCIDDEDGVINITVDGGILNEDTDYSYTWSATDGGIVPEGQENNQNLTGLAAGTYTVDVEDNSGCVLPAESYTITEPNLLTVELDPNNPSTEMLDCLNDTDGVINIVVEGGIPDYTFNWSATEGGIIPAGQENNQNLTGLVAGTYTVDVLDGNNCPETLIFIIEEPSLLTVELDPDNPSTEMLDCYLDADGVINITVELSLIHI